METQSSLLNRNCLPTDEKIVVLQRTDAWLVRDSICFVETGCDPVVVRTVNTDLLVLMIIHSPFMNEIYNSTRGLAMMGSNLRQIKVYDVIEFACTIGHIS